MIDLPATRADVTVTEWLKPGATIDLGGRVLQVLHVPGHTPTSVALYDAARHQLFAGDFLYPTTLYAFLPGSSLSAYRKTTRPCGAARNSPGFQFLSGFGLGTGPVNQTPGNNSVGES